jgi:hypothetical protein
VLKFIGMHEDWVTIVGVIGDTKDGGLDAVPRNVVYRPFTQMPAFAGAGLVIRAQANAASLAPAATRVVRNIAPKEPIENVLTIDQIRDESVAPRRLNAILVSSLRRSPCRSCCSPAPVFSLGRCWRCLKSIPAFAPKKC